MAAPKTITVRLAGDEYVVPKFNIGQLERVADVTDGDERRGRKAFDIIRIAFERATPKVDLNEVEADPDEIKVAIEAIMKLAGLAVPKPADPSAPAGETA